MKEKEWSKRKPRTNGYFWYKRKDGNKTIGKIWDRKTDMPMIAWIGTDWDSELNETEGEWIGPLTIPD